MQDNAKVVATKNGRRVPESDDEYEEEADGVDVSTNDHMEVDGTDSDGELETSTTRHQPSKPANEVFNLNEIKISSESEEGGDAVRPLTKGKRVKGGIESAAVAKLSKQKAKAKKRGVIETDSEPEVEMQKEYCPKTCGAS